MLNCDCGRLQVRVSKLDVADPAEAQQILEVAQGMAPVGGIFHLAMTLTDKLLPNQVGHHLAQFLMGLGHALHFCRG